MAYLFQDLCPSTEEEEGKATLELTKEYDTVEEEEGEERRARRKEEGKGGGEGGGGGGGKEGRGREGERREGLGYRIHMLIHLQMMSKTRRQLLVQSIH